MRLVTESESIMYHSKFASKFVRNMFVLFVVLFVVILLILNDVSSVSEFSAFVLSVIHTLLYKWECKND